MTTANVILSQVGVTRKDRSSFTNPLTVTIETRPNDKENITKSLIPIPNPKTTKAQEGDTSSSDYGANDTKIIDILNKVEQRVTINGHLTNGKAGISSKITDDPLSSGASTINVVSTQGMPNNGDGLIANSDNFSYTGKTPTSLTGVTGITKDHTNNEFVMILMDSSTLAIDKKKDLIKIVTGGGVFNMTYEGETFLVNTDKIEIANMSGTTSETDLDVPQYSVTFTAIKGVNF
jgi:hypothetical protein